MFDLIVNEDTSDREMILHLIKRIHAMALDLSKLTAAIALVSTDVTALINADATAAGAAAAQLAVDQAAVDALVPTVTAIDTVAQAALTAPVAPPATAAV